MTNPTSIFILATAVTVLVIDIVAGIYLYKALRRIRRANGEMVKHTNDIVAAQKALVESTENFRNQAMSYIHHKHTSNSSHN